MTNNEKVALRQAAERAQAASNAYTACVISQEEFLAETSDYRTLIRGPERVLALLAERDADKKRIAELEARTVSVKLPPKVDSSNLPFAAQSWNSCIDEVTKRLAATGVNVEFE